MFFSDFRDSIAKIYCLISTKMDPRSDMCNIRSFKHNVELQETRKTVKHGYFSDFRDSIAKVHCLFLTQMDPRGDIGNIRIFKHNAKLQETQ